MLENKIQTVIVTGASGSVGSQVVKNFANQGMKVVGLCHSASGCERLKGLLGDCGNIDMARVLLIHGSQSDEGKAQGLLEEAFSFLGTVDGFVHAVGRFRYAMMENTTIDDYDELFTANTKSPWLLARGIFKHMKANGFGRMVFVSSVNTTSNGVPGMGLYTASKMALNGLILALSKEVNKKENITVNAVLPSIIDTPENREMMPHVEPSDWVHPKDLAKIIDFFFQDHARIINGALLPVTSKV